MGKRICEGCGKSYYWDDAESEFDNIYGYGAYAYEFNNNSFCGECAIEVYEHCEFDDDMAPAGCAACGNPAYPKCEASCPLFDD